MQAPLLQSLLAELDDLADVRELIERTLIDEPPALAREGGFTRDGVDPELDELQAHQPIGRQVIAEMEERERARTGIASLKVRFNRVFGYYIEISKSNLHAVPADYQRKQTIAGGERFTTPALKEYEEKVLGADERILDARDRDLRGAAPARSLPRRRAIQDTARALATLDVLAALAETARRSPTTPSRTCTTATSSSSPTARHPVVERFAGDAFVPNDIDLNGATRQLVDPDRPEHGRQVDLPAADRADPAAWRRSDRSCRRARRRCRIVDRIFARVGASDNIARGQSTFMVEMQETANILHTATSRSLVVLDEIGRGTSTFDGLSIAWAVAEHLATNSTRAAEDAVRHALSRAHRSGRRLPGVVNAHVSAREWKDEIIFLRKIVSGRSDRSYGIQVARLAGLPATVVTRAQEILAGLERDEAVARRAPHALSRRRRTVHGAARSLRCTARRPVSTRGDEVLTRLKAIDVDNTTPRQALELLAELKKLSHDT